MVVSYTGRHMEITEDMKAFVEKKLQKIKFHFDQIINIDFIIEVQRGQYTIEIKVKSNMDLFFAKDTDAIWEKALESVTDKIEKKVVKKKEKIKSHH